jgi:sugar/nucleoside kinase (ribokinase family)
VAPEPADLGSSLLSRAAVVHVAAMPLDHAERIVARVRQQAPGAVLTLDTHESWDASVAGRVLALARRVDVFVPSQEELAGLVDADGPAAGLSALAAAGCSLAVVKAAAAGAYLLENGRIVHVPALQASPTARGPATPSAAAWPRAWPAG